MAYTRQFLGVKMSQDEEFDSFDCDLRLCDEEKLRAGHTLVKLAYNSVAYNQLTMKLAYNSKNKHKVPEKIPQAP